MRKVHQVTPFEHFPTGDGWEVAVLKSMPSDLSQRFGIEFERGLDDLDYYLLAAIDDVRVGQVWLWMYERSPMPGTTVIVDAAVRRDTALAAVRRQLGFGDVDYVWVNEYECDPRLDAIRDAMAARTAQAG